VTDDQGGVLPAVDVELRSTESRLVERLTTDAFGFYRFEAVAPGSYEIIFRLSGFREIVEPILVASGELASIDTKLTMAPFAQRVDVVAVSPILGSGIDKRKIPTLVSTTDGAALRSRRAPSIADALHERLGPVTLEDTTSNPFQPTLRFRGFTASPLLGLPQGVAVYQNGVRINEPFGDTVQFDLIPQFALERVQLSAGAEPTFGLNALGGAMAMRLKTGFDAPGLRAEVTSGSFSRVTATAELGLGRGPWSFYLGASGFTEDGYRTASDSDLAQAVADLSFRKDGIDAGVSVTYADTRLNGNGPAPEALIEADPSAVYTFPDTTENRLAFLQGRAHLEISSSTSVQLTGFFRDLDRNTLNGDEAMFERCEDDSLPPGAPGDTLCTGADDEQDEGPEPDAIVEAFSGRFITARDAEGDGALNRTFTRAKGAGGSFQLSSSRSLSGHENVFVTGLSVDLADVSFASELEVGTLTPERSVDGSGLLAGIFLEAPDDVFNTALDVNNKAIGVYLSDTFSVSERAHVTASGRFNDVRVDIHDQLGSSLDGAHRFSRFNPALGIALQVGDSWSVFGRYSESSRAPTAAELSCADPDEPCRVPNAFVSDPPLEQAVGRSVEAGGRGASGGVLEWSAAVYRTDIRDDILFVASPSLIGAGFFQNAGDTRRVGADIHLQGAFARLDWYASYGLVNATFESALTLPGPESETGDNDVTPGDRLPGIPRHSLKVGGRFAATPAVRIDLETILASERFFVGDESNEHEPLPGYGLVNLRASYSVNERFEIFARVANLFDADYATFGVLAEVEIDLEEVPGEVGPRFISPGAPRSAWAGASFRF